MLIIISHYRNGLPYYLKRKSAHTLLSGKNGLYKSTTRRVKRKFYDAIIFLLVNFLSNTSPNRIGNLLGTKYFISFKKIYIHTE